MSKQKINIEYPLSTKSPNIVWELISTDHGLRRWLADHVEEEDGVFSFTWGEAWTEHHTLKAQLLERTKHSHIRLQWEEDADTEAFWEMRIGRSELTNQCCLFVTDYAPEDEQDDLKELWDANLERLHASSGL